MTTVNMMVRVPADVRNWVADAAKSDDRSMNWLIVSILKGAMEAQTKNAPTAVTVRAPN